MSHSLSRRHWLKYSCAIAGLPGLDGAARLGAGVLGTAGAMSALGAQPLTLAQAVAGQSPRTAPVQPAASASPAAAPAASAPPASAPASPHASAGRFPTLSSLPPVPASLNLDFDVYYGDSTARGVHVAHAVYRLSHRQEEYRLETEARATGVLAVFYSGALLQSSTGSLGARGFLPRRYTEKRGRRPERQLDFDREAGRIKLAGDPAVNLPFPDGTQDRLSVFFQLGLLARGNPSIFRPGQRFVLPLAGTHRIDEPLFRVISQEALRTQAGAFQALHIAVSKPGDADAPKFDIWLAPAIQMLPVRIRVVDGSDGKVVDQVLRNRPAGV